MMSPLLLRTNLPQMFAVYDIQAFQNISKDFQGNILGGAILVYNHYSEHPVCSLTKRKTPPPVFSGETFENGWFWTASEQSKRKISMKTFLAESFQRILLFETLKVWVFSKAISSNFLDPPQEVFLTVTTPKNQTNGTTSSRVEPST